MEKFCFCFDIDGTLYPSNHVISKRTLETIEKLREKGHKIVVATGRNLSSVEKSGLLEQVQFDALVLNNGQCVLNDKGEVIYAKYMPTDLVWEIIDVCGTNGIVCSLETVNDWFCVQQPNEYVKITHDFFRETAPHQGEYNPSMKIIMAMAYAPKGYDYTPLKEIDGLNVDIGNSCYADLGLKGFHKYKGIEKCLEYFDLTKTVCFGDGSNDVEMIRHATIGIAMGQSIEQVKEVSDFVTKNCDDDGIVYACEHYKFI